ncbi:MAG: NADH-quinone oxidoreductase subunit L [Blastocatellia bacterium]|nr:MAG: NADH-quinone oxidoreductase subunit L [Blastocatellia bacterium]
MLLLIPALPFLGFLLNASFGRRVSKTAAGVIACGAVAASFIVSLVVVWRLIRLAADSRVISMAVFDWITSGDFTASVTLRVDPLSAVMILIVSGIGSLIHIYSTAYMHEERDSEYARYFSYLNLFAAFMLVLVLASNLLVMFVGWEGVGLCSYLLIGFWYQKTSASDAGKKAFIVNRVGDFGFILGVLLAFVRFGTLDFQEIARSLSTLGAEPSFGVLSLITLLLFVGATGKSAQIPLHIWLPDAMEGPTPVSALIHAATMVTAGVYMIGRNAVLFSHAPQTLAVVAGVGVATALMAGTIGLVQNDIKRVLAYSTVSQLGYMFLAMGVGAYAAGIFHLYTHAFFKALLFLGSGAVIHALAGEQDLRRMGGLKQQLPITYWTFVIGAIAIAGIPPFAGFFSKDEILYRTFSSGHTVLWAVGLMTSLLTAIYMFRLVYLAFHGTRGGDNGHAGTAASVHHHLHDAPPAMALALIVLAVGSVVAGSVGVPHALGGSNRIEQFLAPSFGQVQRTADTAPAEQARPDLSAAGDAGSVRLPEDHGAESETLEFSLMSLSVIVAVAGIGIATFFFLRNRHAADEAAIRFAGVHRILANKYYVDELYDAAVIRPVRILSEQGLWKVMDARVIDGAVNGLGEWIRGGGEVLRRLQTGSVRAYAASLFLGVVLILGYYLWR